MSNSSSPDDFFAMNDNGSSEGDTEHRRLNLKRRLSDLSEAPQMNDTAATRQTDFNMSYDTFGDLFNTCQGNDTAKCERKPNYDQAGVAPPCHSSPNFDGDYLTTGTGKGLYSKRSGIETSGEEVTNLNDSNVDEVEAFANVLPKPLAISCQVPPQNDHYSRSITVQQQSVNNIQQINDFENDEGVHNLTLEDIDLMLEVLRRNDSRFDSDSFNISVQQQQPLFNVDEERNGKVDLESRDIGSPCNAEMDKLQEEFFEPSTSQIGNEHKPLNEELQTNSKQRTSFLNNREKTVEPTVEKGQIAANRKNRSLNKCRDFGNIVIAHCLFKIARDTTLCPVDSTRQQLENLAKTIVDNTQCPDVRYELEQFAPFFDETFASGTVLNNILVVDPKTEILKQFLTAQWTKKREDKAVLNELLNELKAYPGNTIVDRG